MASVWAAHQSLCHIDRSAFVQQHGFKNFRKCVCFSAAMWLSYVGAGLVLQMVCFFLQMAGSMQQQGHMQPAGHDQVVLRHDRHQVNRAPMSVYWRHACSSHGITRRMLTLVTSSSSPGPISRCGGGVTGAHRAIRMSGRLL